MNAWKALCLCSLVLLCSGTAFAQDPVKVDLGHYEVVFENASVRVLKVDYAAGEKSSMHQHPDAIVVPLADTKVRFTMPDGKTEDAGMANEVAVYMPAGTHSSANVGAGRIDGLLVEFKSAAPGTAELPVNRDGLSTKGLAEGPRAMAYRSTASPTFQEPSGSKHDYDQVVISLGPSQMSLSIDGKPAKTTWARGDVQFIGRGVAHESKNASGKPVDFVIVGIK
jgi:quercetin dioxygenase-like cupin family protein